MIGGDSAIGMRFTAAVAHAGEPEEREVVALVLGGVQGASPPPGMSVTAAVMLWLTTSAGFALALLVGAFWHRAELERLALEQHVGADMQHAADRPKLLDVGAPVLVLPLADRRRSNAEGLGKLRAAETASFANTGQERAE